MCMDIQTKLVEVETIDEIFKELDLHEPEMVETITGEFVKKSTIEKLKFEYPEEMELY